MRSTLRFGPRSTAVAVVTATLVIAAALVVLVPPKAANAAELTEITDFGDNPSDLRMYLYVPDNLAPDPAVLVAAHYCTGTGPEFHDNTEFASLADEHGFIVVYPSVTRDSECFDVSSPEALTRGGGSDPVGIASMVDHVLDNHGADSDRVFITGHSSGGMMTNVMLGLYPDVFSAGAAFAGVPFGCFATDDGSGWNSDCANGAIDHTPREWGDMVRDAYPGYDGPRPRMQLWHGTEDDTLDYDNFGEAVEQWTDVLGTDRTPERTDSPEPSWTRTRYGGTGARAPVEAISLEGAGHNFMASGMASRVGTFFGLDDPGQPPSGDCTATIEIVDEWGTGWHGTVHVTAGDSDLTGWTVTWTWPDGQRLTHSWNADVGSDGATVTAGDSGWNGTIGSGSTRRGAFGFLATGPSAAPTVTCDGELAGRPGASRTVLRPRPAVRAA